MSQNLSIISTISLRQGIILSDMSNYKWTILKLVVSDVLFPVDGAIPGTHHTHTRHKILTVIASLFKLKCNTR